MNATSCQVPHCRNESRYVCPRCSVRYCSVPCYAAHSEKCVEIFSRQNRARLAGVKASKREQVLFQKLLNRLRNDPKMQSNDDASSGFNSHDLDIGRDSPALNAQSETEILGFESDSIGDDSGRDSADILRQPKALFPSTRCELEEKNLLLALERLMKPLTGSEDEPSRVRQEKEVELTSHRTFSDEEAHGSSSDAVHSGEPIDLADILEELAYDMEQQNLSYDQILSRLPMYIADKFHELVKERRFQMKPWTPWWYVRNGRDRDNDRVKEPGDDCEEPACPPPLPRHSDLLVLPQTPQQKASPHLIYSVIDVLASSCAILRIHDGDCLSDPLHAGKTLWQLSPVLSSDTRYESMNETCKGCLQTISSMYKREFALATFEDVAAVLGGNSEWVSRCLFQTQTMLLGTVKEIPAKQSRITIKKGMRKVAYMLAWALCQPSTTFRDAARMVGSFAEIEQGKCEEIQVAQRAVRLVRKTRETRIDEV